MKYLKLFESFDESKIHDIFRIYGMFKFYDRVSTNSFDYTINDDGTVDVYGFVFLGPTNPSKNIPKLKKLPIKFNKVNGNFRCDNNELITLEGSPVEMNGYFDCSNNQLESLEGSPVEINHSRNNITGNISMGGHFDCSRNKLKSFEFAPKIIRGDFNCSYNKIVSFEYFPIYIGGEFPLTNHSGEIFNCIGNPIYQVWRLFEDLNKIELLNDFDIFRDEDTDTPSIVMDRLNDFLLTIGKDPVEKVYRYKNI